MREEIKDWLKQAEADLRKAEILYNAGEFDGVAFNSHQSVEKSLKALFIKTKGESKPGHSLIYLAICLKVPEEMISGIRDLSPEYLVARYPDIAGGAPIDLYDGEIALKHKKTAEKILKWVKSQIQK
jgi:HEPN domain-containing protein